MTARPPLSRLQSAWLVAAALAAAWPHFRHVPVWLALATTALLAWRGWQVAGNRRLPARPWLLAIAAGGLIGVLAEYRTPFGQNPGIALLLVFLGLKHLEARTVRDGLAATFLACFLTMAQLFHSQAIASALAVALASAVILVTLAALVDDQPTPADQLRLAGRLAAHALPLMLVAFILFPRVQGPLWGLPKDAHSGRSGLSDQMSPGTISELIQSDDIAFRARFDGPPPAAELRYWRGPVLTRFDGRTWRPRPSAPTLRLPYTAPAEAASTYDITLEASGKPWLFALERPSTLPANTYVSADGVMLTRAPVVERQRYRLAAFFAAPNWQTGDDDLLRAALALPSGFNPRTRELGAGWRSAAGTDDEEVLRQAIAFFRGQNLTYTLLPPLLGRDTADEFLFDTRAGFCEHFASAFAIALRSAGVPARVVTGYLGGESNPVDGYMIVRQSDAHAWVEVWMAGGWRRIDPTAISAPRRLAADVAAALPAGDPLPAWLRIQNEWLRDLRWRWEAVANTWNQWLLGYDSERQRDLLRRLGMPSPDWRSMTVALGTASAIALTLLAVLTLRQRRRQDPLQALWLRACGRLGRSGLPRLGHEGPLAYAERVATARPEIATTVRDLADCYARLRYGPPDPAGITQLRRRVAEFKP